MGFVEWIQKQAVAYTFYGIALAFMFGLAAVVVAKLFVIGTKKDKLEYLKNYKKGSFLLIYIIAIPLYFFGCLHAAEAVKNGTGVLLCFLTSIKDAFNLVKLDFGANDIIKAMANDSLYYATMVVCFLITAFNVVLFSASLLWQRFINLCKIVRAVTSKNLYVVVGANNNNILMLNSLKSSGNKKVRGLMLAKPSADMRDKLYLNGICYSSFDSENGGSDELYKKMKSLFGSGLGKKLYVNKNVSVIINTEDDERNLLYVKALSELLQTDVQNLVNRYDKLVQSINAKFEEECQKIKALSYDQEIKDKKIKQCTKDRDERQKICTKLISVPINADKLAVMVYSFCNVENQSAFNEYLDKARGHICLLNRHEQIALDFVDKYPLTHFMTTDHIDCDKGLIKSGVEINVCLVGFGPTNRQIFLKTVSDAQFFKEVDGKIVHQNVHYYAFDKEEAYKDKNLNQTYYRYSLEFYKEYKAYKEKMQESGVSEGSDSWDYLPLPDYPADDWFNPELNLSESEYDKHFKKHFCDVDINSYDFYERLKEVVVGGNSYTYIIVAFGEDLENIDLAKKISARLDMWGNSKDAHVFAKVRSDALTDKQMQDDGIVKFGSVRSVYDINKIANSKLKELSYLKSFTYTRSGGGSISDRRKQAIEKWMQSSREQKSGNIYCCLNLRTKLNLLGFDYVRTKDKGANAVNEFRVKYYGTSEPEKVKSLRYIFDKGEVNGKEVYTYDTKIFFDGSVRTLLAMQEHQRWNACYICNGVIPSTKGEIDGKGGGKDMKKRLVHYNLTTFDGLDEYRIKAAGQASATDKYKEEVRLYDYRIMDYADLILEDAGYKIIRK